MPSTYATLRKGSVVSTSSFYQGISVTMLATLVVSVIGHLADRSNALLVVELVWIALFGTFGVMQTRELWNQGLRKPN